MTATNSSGNISSNQGFLQRHSNALILFICWMLVQLLLIYQYGIVTDMEARKYITEAKNIISNGTVSTPNFWLYSVEIFLIAIALKLKTGFVSVYIVQLIFNLIAAWSLYKYISHISNKPTGIVITLFFIFNFPLQTFNSFLQTESLFYSLTILFSCYLFRFTKFSVKTFLITLLFLSLICFTRPTGILFLPGTFLYLLFKFFPSLSIIKKTTVAAIALILFVFILNSALGSGGEFDFIRPLIYEHIICGVPAISDRVNTDVSGNFNSIYDIASYIIHHFDQFSRLAWLRTKAFFGLHRPYYSTGHNIYLYLYFFPFYILTLLSIRNWLNKNKYVFLYCVTLVILTWVMVMLTCDDWHNRFFLTLVPYIYILSALTVHKLLLYFKELTKKEIANS